MRRVKTLTAGLFMAASSAAFAGESAYQSTHGVDADRTSTPKVILTTQPHPAVAVSSSLAAQPVHPYLMHVQIDQMNTYIDPMQRLDLMGMDESHSLVKAQRLYRSLAGISSSDLAAVGHAELMAKANVPMANRAMIVVMPKPRAEQATETAGVNQYLPAVQPRNLAPAPKPRPDVPRPKTFKYQVVSAE